MGGRVGGERETEGKGGGGGWGVLSSLFLRSGTLKRTKGDQNKDEEP